MASPTRIHGSKAPRRLHFIEEWAKRRGFKKAAHLAAELGIDKSQVSRWYNKGQVPQEDMLDRLAGLFGLLDADDRPDPRRLFRDPDDDWFAYLFTDKPTEERKDLKEMIDIYERRRRAG